MALYPYDPYWNNVVLLINGLGSPGGAIVDSSRFNVPLTLGGTQPPTLVNTNSKIAGGTSIGFGATGGYVDISGMGNNGTVQTPLFGLDFTVELWLLGTRWDSPTNTIMGWNSSDNTAYWGSGLVDLGNNTANNPVVPFTAVQTPSEIDTTSWHHHAWVRTGLQLYYWIDGVLNTQRTQTVRDIVRFGQGGKLGAFSNGATPQKNSWFQGLRITNGVCRYPAPFTPSFPYAQGFQVALPKSLVAANFTMPLNPFGVQI